MRQDRALLSLLAASRLALGATLEALAREGRLSGLVLVDATCGNGHDTLFLRTLLTTLEGGENCRILAFDVQNDALTAARARLGPQAAGVDFLPFGHERFADTLELHAPAGGTPPGVAAAVYNLGFLPGGDKRVITRPESTLASLEQAARFLAPGGLLAVHAYGGHTGGQAELAAVENWFSALPYAAWRVMRYAQCNKPRNPEALFLAERRMPA